MTSAANVSLRAILLERLGLIARILVENRRPEFWSYHVIQFRVLYDLSETYARFQRSPIAYSPLIRCAIDRLAIRRPPIPGPTDEKVAEMVAAEIAAEQEGRGNDAPDKNVPDRPKKQWPRDLLTPMRVKPGETAEVIG